MEKLIKNLPLLADKILEKLPTLVKLQKKELYKFNGKYFEPLKDEYLHETIFQFFIDNNSSKQWNIKICDDTIKTMKRMPKHETVDEFNTSERYLNLNNGVFDLTKYELLSHDEKYQFSTIIDVDFDNDKTMEDAPNFMEFLETTFITPDNKVDTATINNIIMMGGYLMYPKNVKEILFIFLGGGANGKSTLIDIFKSFFPKEFVTSVSLRQMASNAPFSLESLVPSRLNISGEEKGKPIDAENIKKIASGQLMNVTMKHKKAIDVMFRCGLLVDSNNMPTFNNMDYSIMRRLMITEFPCAFLPEHEYEKHKNPEKKRIFPLKGRHTFFNAIMAEKSAIFSIFLNGLKELKKRDFNFLSTQNNKKITKEYEETTDVLGTWLKENYEEDYKKEDYNLVSLSDILTEFTVYYNANYSQARANYNTRHLGAKIKAIFRIEPIVKTLENNKVNGIPKRTTIRAYYLKAKGS